MRIVALMSWYEESPTWLAAATASAARLCDHIVAVDGSYALYPQGRASSGHQQSDAIRLAADAAGMGCTIHVPRERWEGNEVAKRDFMFGLAHLLTRPDRDWLLVIDADELVVECDDTAVRHQLGSALENVATFPLESYEDHTARGEHLTGIEHRTAHPARRLFRAGSTPIRVTGQHWHYVRDGEVLWGRGASEPLEVTGLRLEHRTHLRPPIRREDARTYYRVRDGMRIEAAPGRVEVAA